MGDLRSINLIMITLRREKVIKESPPRKRVPKEWRVRCQWLPQWISPNLMRYHRRISYNLHKSSLWSPYSWVKPWPGHQKEKLSGPYHFDVLEQEDKAYILSLGSDVDSHNSPIVAWCRRRLPSSSPDCLSTAYRDTLIKRHRSWGCSSERHERSMVIYAVPHRGYGHSLFHANSDVCRAEFRHRKYLAQPYVNSSHCWIERCPPPWNEGHYFTSWDQRLRVPSEVWDPVLGEYVRRNPYNFRSLSLREQRRPLLLSPHPPVNPRRLPSQPLISDPVAVGVPPGSSAMSTGRELSTPMQTEPPQPSERMLVPSVLPSTSTL